MKKLLFIFFALVAVNSFANTETVQDSTKSYNNGDMFVATGVTMAGTGALSLLSSRRIGLALIGVGGIVTTVGVVIKFRKRKTNGNR